MAESRFEYVVATDMKSLVEKLNKIEYLFNVTYMVDGVAIIDKFPAMVLPVEEEEEMTELNTLPAQNSPSFA